MVKVAVIGATGYTGQELLKLLFKRADVEVTAITSESSAGKHLGEVLPHFARNHHLTLEKAVPEAIAARADVAFLCLPHGQAMGTAKDYLNKGLKVLDLSADFRLKNPALYKEWYHLEHTAPELLSTAVYGLPELYAENIKGASLVAVPGCYPTSVILAMAPLMNIPGLDTETITVNSASGVSGAGRAPRDHLMFAELDGDYYAYGAPTHRHTTEMEQELSTAAGRVVKVSFIPHLLPVTRGIYSTITMKVSADITEDMIMEALRNFYLLSHFVHIVSGFPRMKWAVNSNHAFIGAKVDKRAGVAIITSVIDNLVKGASGQAMQCFNLMYGLDENEGLD
ncbi:MAG: N-acetyl-gamma-glutamyl-phosphate reductase [Nitrospinota bacterium]|nr:N-acetyl-gamma-glutamyl-phosphate reductase [Nitrospinota bacterium]